MNTYFEFEWCCAVLADTVVGMLIVVTPTEVVDIVVVNTEEPLVNVITVTLVLVNVDTVEKVVHTSLSPELLVIRS
jgi:hypothetical protein